MSVTDELRKLLDERGVEWESEDCPGIDGKVVYRYTCWGDGGSCYYCEPIGAEPGTLGATCDFSAIGITPEQAIEATLGAGTCHDVGDPSDFCCSECGVRMFTDTNDTYTMIASDGRTIIKHPNYCPNCGRKVER